MLGRTFGPKKEEVIEQLKNYIRGSVIICKAYQTLYYYADYIEESETGGTCSTHVWLRRANRISVGKPELKKPFFETKA
jgi:hypothetical protein